MVKKEGEEGGHECGVLDGRGSTGAPLSPPSPIFLYDLSLI